MLNICQRKEEKGDKPGIIVGNVLPTEEVPFIDWEKYNYVPEYEKTLPGKFPQYIYLSRGCPFKSTFRLEKERWQGWRRYSVKKPLECIDKIDERGPAASVRNIRRLLRFQQKVEEGSARGSGRAKIQGLLTLRDHARHRRKEGS